MAAKTVYNYDTNKSRKTFDSKLENNVVLSQKTTWEESNSHKPTSSSNSRLSVAVRSRDALLPGDIGCAATVMGLDATNHEGVL